MSKAKKAVLVEKRRPHSIFFPPEEDKTKQSFKDQCDINKIVAQFTRTGFTPHLARISPQYGEAPDQDFFTAACNNAEVHSAIEEGFDMDPPEKTPPEPPEEASAEAIPGLDDIVEKPPEKTATPVEKDAV